MGFKRNLSSGEIVPAPPNALLKSKKEPKVTNVVFMGMGEPLDNYDQGVKACSLMISPQVWTFKNQSYDFNLWVDPSN